MKCYFIPRDAEKKSKLKQYGLIFMIDMKIFLTFFH